MRDDLPTESLIAANLAVLRQGLELLEQIDDRLYAGVAAPLFEYGVSSHFRHCLDAYRCFLDGVTTGRVDYDRRERDARTEADRAHATERLRLTMGRLEELSSTDLPRGLQSKQDSPVWADSSVHRELQFLLSHTVHHYALVALMLRVRGFSPAADLGVAPSTLDHWKSGKPEEALCVR
jgi:uncharacterized damage-inducible protein DinB